VCVCVYFNQSCTHNKHFAGPVTLLTGNASPHRSPLQPCSDGMSLSTIPCWLTGRLHLYLITSYHHPVWSEWFTNGGSPPSS